MNATALFHHDGDGYLADPVADGPWAEGALHGGAPAALLAQVLSGELAGSGLSLARLTCEFLRPTPRGPLRVSSEVVRPGRRVTLLEATLSDDEGTVVTRARALFLAAAGLSAGVEAGVPFPGPEDGAATDWANARPMFATHAMEVRFVEGRFRAVGPATAWFRLRPELLDGEPTSGVARVAAAADFGNGIASELPWEGHTFLNADLTIALVREPVDEWVALRARMTVREGGVALAESDLYDREGRIGRATQSLLVT